jgi:hypothetical protein
MTALAPLDFSAPTNPRHVKNFHRYGALRTNWEASKRFLANLREALSSALTTNVETVAVAGSFGRLEGSQASDGDYILIVRDTSAPSLASDTEKIHAAIRKLGVSPPNKSGVFSAPRTQGELVKDIGGLAEEPDELAKRMLLLLESRPVFGDVNFLRIIQSIFEKYAHDVNDDLTKEHVFLLNDLIRYFRYICVNYQLNFWRENEKWPIRNLKLRHSRLLMYSGLLFILGEASKYQDESKISIVWDWLPLTPLERIAAVYEANKDFAFHRVIGLYNVFTAKLSDPDVRPKLSAIEYTERYETPAFAELKANSDAFVAELARFVYSRRGAWSDRFFEYLLF